MSCNSGASAIRPVEDRPYFTSTRYPPMDATAFPDDGSSVSTVDYWNAGGWTLSFWNLQIRKPNDPRALRARCVR